MVFLTKIQTWPVIDAATFRMRTVIVPKLKRFHFESGSKLCLENLKRPLKIWD